MAGFQLSINGRFWVSTEETNEGTAVVPLTGVGVFAVPMTGSVAHLTVRSATDNRVLWDDARSGKGVTDLVKALLKRLAESGPPPARLATAKVDSVGLKNPGRFTCEKWVGLRTAAAAAESAAEAGRPLDPGPPDPATVVMSERIMVATITAWLQGHVRGAFDLGFWLAMSGRLDQPTQETLRAGFDAQQSMPEAEAIPAWLDTYCSTHPDESLGAVAVRVLRQAYPLAAR